MKKVGLLLAFLGLAGAIYAKGGFSGLKSKLVKEKSGEHKDKPSGKNRSSVSQSYGYGTTELDY
jgi:hypothetical protein